MKQFFTYQSFLKSIIYLLLIGQVWANTASYCYWMIDSDSELIELCNLENSDSEEEEDKKKEKDDKVRIALEVPILNTSTLLENIFHSEGFTPMYHPETFTPPPEYSLFLS